MNAGYALIEFYISIVAYYILHMIFVIAGDFVDAFNIPPLNIGIYVDKLAAIRALLMVMADAIEYGCLDKAADDSGKAQKALKGGGSELSPRRIGSIVSLFVMVVCRLYYLWIINKKNNKSLSVFVTLCIEGFWFGVFQMSFFAIGPEYNAITSLGIHTMGNFIFFFQLIMEHYAKSRPNINSLYRVRVHGWICLVSSVLALGLWIYFCYDVTASGDDAPSQWPSEYDVLSPLLLFPVGAFAEDFSVPGILPFAFLDPEKANLVNYLGPVFFMSGAILIVLFNDGIKDCKFKDWSAMTHATDGMPWHGLWALNIPKYISFFIAMFSIHGIFPKLRCIVQSRWRVMLLTMFIIIPRSILEVAGYVGVANYAIGRADQNLVVDEYVKTLAAKLNSSGNINRTTGLTTSNLKTAISNQPEVKNAIAALVSNMFNGAEVADKTGQQGQKKEKDIEAAEVEENTGSGKIKVEFTGGASGTGTSEEAVVTGNDVRVTINIQTPGSLKTGGTDNNNEAKVIANKIKDAVNKAKGSEPNGLKEGREASRDFNAFAYIAAHDMLAMFCRFFYGKLAVGYNWTRISLGYCLPKFRPRHKGFGFGFWWWFGRTFSRAWADTIKDFKADIKDYL